MSPPIDEALALARASVKALGRWLESRHAADPRRGAARCSHLPLQFPDTPIVVDLEDDGWRGTRSRDDVQGGGDMVVVDGQAHDASIIEQVKMAQNVQHESDVRCSLLPDKRYCAAKRRRWGSITSSSIPGFRRAQHD